MSSSACLSILVWSEDGAETSYKAVAALARKMLTLLDPRCQTNRVEFEPLNDDAAHALKGGGWKGARGRDRHKVVDLRRAIAGKLVQGTGDVPGFVLFHVDGDRAWRFRADSDTHEKFAELVAAIEPLVLAALEKKGRTAELRALMGRCRALVPFHSIEAWLFQNTAELARICEASCGRHLGLIAAWAANRGELDELEGDEQPKNKVPCVATVDHVALASKAYPAGEVFAIDKSYTAAVMGLLECDALSAALSRTYAS